MFRKTYVGAKKSIDDWLRKVTQQEISVEELRKLKSLKSFTRSTMRELKCPRRPTRISPAKSTSAAKQLEEHEKLDTTGLPTFEIDNSQNVMMLMVEDERDARVIVESFLQANVKTRTKYKCSVLHQCAKENQITLDSYYIVKNIIFQILKTVPAIANYIKLQEH